MNVNEWDRDFAAACLSSVDAMLKECGPGDFVARRSLESHRDELAARVASVGTSQHGAGDGLPSGKPTEGEQDR